MRGGSNWGHLGAALSDELNSNLRTVSRKSDGEILAHTPGFTERRTVVFLPRILARPSASTVEPHPAPKSQYIGSLTMFSVGSILISDADRGSQGFTQGDVASHARWCATTLAKTGFAAFPQLLRI
jgi:hypothetical protein